MNLTEFAGTLLRVLILPPAFLLLLIVFGYLLRRRWPAVGTFVSRLGVLLLVVLSTNAGALLLLRPLEEMTTPLLSVKDSGAEAIVVLAAGNIERAPDYAGHDVPDAYGLERIHYAAYLQHASGLPVLTSGGLEPGGGSDEPLALTMARTLREDFKTPVKWTEDQSRTTAENAEFSARMLKAAGVTRILLVTHAMHMPRSREAFARHGLTVVDAPTHFYSRSRWTGWMLVPSAKGLTQATFAWHEWVGLAWYRLQARLNAP